MQSQHLLSTFLNIFNLNFQIFGGSENLTNTKFIAKGFRIKTVKDYKKSLKFQKIEKVKNVDNLNKMPQSFQSFRFRIFEKIRKDSVEF